MKITKEHYSLIKEQIIKGISTKQNLAVNEFIKEWDKAYTDYTETRKLWDLYWKSGANEWKAIAFNGNIYGGDYNDSHITTALKKIYKELLQ